MKIDRLGTWYADALPSGEFVVRFDTYLQTNDELVKWGDGFGPQDGLLFPVLNPLTRHFMGQAQTAPQSGEAWEWDSVVGWMKVSDVCKGVSPCIYGFDGTRYISDAGVGVGSQGYRYIDQTTQAPVSGDASYSPRPDLELYEWTDLGDGYFIGQGPKSGAWFRGPDLKYRLLVDGPCRFIRAHRTGDRMSMGCWVEREASALLWATFAELMALPAVDHPPPDVPVPQPEPLPPLPAIPTLPAMFAGGDNTHIHMNGNAVWTPYDSQDSRVWMEDAAWPAGVGPMLCGCWTSDGNKRADETIQKQITYTQLKNAHALEVIQDDYSAMQASQCNVAATDVRLAGLTPIHSLHVVEGARPAIWMRECLKGLHVNLQTVIRDNAEVRRGAIWAVNRCLQGDIAVLWFTRAHVCLDAELLAWVNELLATVQKPVLLPGQPLPVPPEPPTPQPPEPQPPKLGFWAKLALAIKLWGKGNRGHR